MGKMLPVPAFASVYYKMSQGQPPVPGPWNQGSGLQLVEDPPLTADGGDGSATVTLGR